MKNKAYVGLIVFVALIVPLGMGFLMPSTTTTEKGYINGETMDVTAGMQNSSYYADTTFNNYLNNQFLVGWDDESIGDYWEPVEFNPTTQSDFTTVKNAYPHLIEDSRTLVVATAGTIDLASTYPDDCGYDQVCFSTPDARPGWQVTFDDGTNTATTIIYYPKTALCYGAVWSNGQYGLVEMGTTLTVTPVLGPGSSYDLTLYVQDTDNGLPEYLYPDSHGFAVYNSALWMNTHTNKAVAFIVETANLGKIMRFGNYGLGGQTFTLEMSYASGNVQFTLGGETQVLGDPAVYPKVLIYIDAGTDTVSVSGLMGVDSFTQRIVDGNVGKTVTFDVTGLDPFTSVQLMPDDRHPNVLKHLNYWVSYAVIETNSTYPAIEDNTLDPSKYYPRSASNSVTWSIKTYSPTVFGTSLTLSATGWGSATYNVAKDGTITVTDTDGIVRTIPVNGLAFAIVPVTAPESDPTGTYWGLQASNYVLAVFSSATPSLTLTFDGLWAVGVSITEIEETGYNHYGWTYGMFNIDQKGFCTWGLIASFLGFLALGVYARTQGDGVMVPLVAAVMCGGTYLLLLTT